MFEASGSCLPRSLLLLLTEQNCGWASPLPSPHRQFPPRAAPDRVPADGLQAGVLRQAQTGQGSSTLALAHELEHRRARDPALTVPEEKMGQEGERNLRPQVTA